MLAFLLLHTVLSLDATRPLMHWSSADGPHSFDDMAIDVKNILTKIDPEKEQLTFGFVFEELDLNTLQTLKNKISSDETLSSQFYPFVRGKFRITSNHNGRRVQSFEDYLNLEDPSIQVVVFEPKTQAEMEAFFTKAREYEQTSGRNVGYFVTSDQPVALPSPKSPYRGVVFATEYMTYNTSTNYVGPLSVTPFTLQALLIVLITFLGACIGNICMSEVQVPITYLHKELPIRKEY